MLGLARRIGLGLASATVCACAAQDRELHVGHAVPVGDGARVLVDLARASLDSSAMPRLAIMQWEHVRTTEVGSETGQAERFASDPRVIAVVGHAGSKSTLLASPIYEAAGMPVIVPTATSGLMRDAREHLFPLSPPDDVEGAFLADYALDSLKATRVAMLYVSDAFGVGIHVGVRARMGDRRRSLTGDAALAGEECTQEERDAMPSIVRALVQRASPDVVIVALSTTQTVCAVRALVALDPKIRILAADAFDPSEVYRGTLKRAERDALRYVVAWEPGPDSVSLEFVRRARAMNGRDPTPGQALTHDAFMLVAQAVGEGHTSRAAIRRWLLSLGTPGHPPYVGVTGPIAFNEPRRTILRVRALPPVRE